MVKSILSRHPGEPTLVIGAYLDQLDELGDELDAPVIQGSTKNAEREALYDAFRRGEVSTLVVSKVANFSIDLPEAAVAVQVSGTFGSRQEEAQRLGRLLRPKADGGGAIFYSVVARDSLDAEYAAHRQRFLAEQGYGYIIRDADDLLGPGDLGGRPFRATGWSPTRCRARRRPGPARRAGCRAPDGRRPRRAAGGPARAPGAGRTRRSARRWRSARRRC